MSLDRETCIPCQGGIAPLSSQEAEQQLTQIQNWHLNDTADRITRKYPFPSFMAALAFVNKIATLCEKENHHPDITFGWGYAEVTFYTHKIKGLHENDFIMAAKCNTAFHPNTVN